MPTNAVLKSNSTKYIIDTKTKNLSFLKMYRYLRDKGVKNNKFFLRLYNVELLGVDPHDPNLTDKQKIMIIDELAKNPFYYIREIARVAAPGGTIRFELHPGNLAIMWAILNSIDQISLLPRQRGKTQSIATMLAWVYDFGTVNSHMVFGNKSLQDANNNLKRFKVVRGFYPSYLKKAVFDAKDIDNIESVKSEKRQNFIDTRGQPLNEKAADKQGRGFTMPVWWPDE